MGSTTLTVEQLASHLHTVRGVNSASGGYGGGSTGRWDATVNTSSVGGSESHTHDLSSVSSGHTSSLPLYYTLNYIMRIM